MLAGLALGGLAVSTAGTGPAAGSAQPVIRPRADWATSPARGALSNEAAGDVRFLLVHHTETSHDYTADSVPRTLNGMFRYHTTDKGWDDIAYNFLVDRFGTIWEGRTGSIGAPVKGDATGGSQGFALLCCFIGNHTSEPPTPAAQEAMSSLLAWLAGRYTIDLHAGRTITFTSRGSNRWPAGTQVTTDPIAGHRDMSRTACPGDACYPLVRGALLTAAQAKAGPAVPAAAPAPAPAPAGETPAPAPVPVTSAAPLPEPPPPRPPSAAASPWTAAELPPPDRGQVTVGGLDPAAVAVIGGGAATAAAAGGAAFLLNRRRQGRELEAEIGQADRGQAEQEPPRPPRDRHAPW